MTSSNKWETALILGIAGQRIVEHYTFFAAFNAPDELRVVHGGDEIGAIAIPPAPGEHLILAGRRWRVESIDVDHREVLVSPARGARPPAFTPTHGVVHAAVHAKMKSLLLGSNEPAYLDSVALEILNRARREATQQERFRRPRESSRVAFVYSSSQDRRSSRRFH